MRAASQSNTEWTGLALKGDRAVLALNGESILETLGLGGTLRLGKQAGPVGGAVTFAWATFCDFCVPDS